MSKEELAIKIVNLFNEGMGGKWDSKMYDQKEKVMKLLNQLNQNKDE